jgi:ABC-type Na+ efflux pump permease subunit
LGEEEVKVVAGDVERIYNLAKVIGEELDIDVVHVLLVLILRELVILNRQLSDLREALKVVRVSKVKGGGL